MAPPSTEVTYNVDEACSGALVTSKPLAAVEEAVAIKPPYKVARPLTSRVEDD